MKIYLAAPLFTSAERAWNKELELLLLQAGHEVFLPQEKESSKRTAEALFDGDRAGLDWADVIVAIMDGPDPDSGTSWECGYAYGKKPIVLVRTDFRSSGDRQIGPFKQILEIVIAVSVESSNQDVLPGSLELSVNAPVIGTAVHLDR